MNEIIEQISKYKNNKQLVEIQHFRNSNTFTVGYIIQTDNEAIIVRTIDPNGKVNGIIIINRENIEKITNKGSYLAAIRIKEKLAQKQGYYDLWDIDNKWQPMHQENSLNAIKETLIKALINKIVLTIGWTDNKHKDTEVTGYLEAVTDEYVNLIYADEHDLDDLWIVPIERKKINFLRLYSFQTFEYQQIFIEVFNEKF